MPHINTVFMECDSSSSTIANFTLTTEDIHTETLYLLCFTAFVYQRLNSDSTKQGNSLHKVSQSFSSIGFLLQYFFFFHTLSLVSKSYTKHSSARDKKEAAFSCKGSHLNANKHSFILITCDRRLQQNQRSMCIHWKTCTRQISIPVHNAKPSIILHQWKWRELAKYIPYSQNNNVL